MIPAAFDYVLADSVEDALAKLADGGEDAKLPPAACRARLAAPRRRVASVEVV